MNIIACAWEVIIKNKKEIPVIHSVKQNNEELKYAVRLDWYVLSKQNKWEYEPSPSNRSCSFLKRTIFDSFEEAVDAIKKYYHISE